jgi:hypothetical protein
MPSNATDTIIFFVGENVADDYNEFEYHYDWFESEMGEGTPVQGDINNYCGAIIYSFNVFNLDGEDVALIFLSSISTIILTIATSSSISMTTVSLDLGFRDVCSCSGFRYRLLMIKYLV